VSWLYPPWGIQPMGVPKDQEEAWQRSFVLKSMHRVFSKKLLGAKRKNVKRISVLALLGLFGRAGAPDGIVSVKGFDLHRYLGTWYEITRLDHSF
jgi:hypothetical protein